MKTVQAIILTQKPNADRGGPAAPERSNSYLKIEINLTDLPRARRLARMEDRAVVPERIFDAACDGKLEEVREFLAGAAAPQDVVTFT